MRLIVVKVPESYVDLIDYLVKKGMYASRSEALRTAIRHLLEEHGLLKRGLLLHDDA